MLWLKGLGETRGPAGVLWRQYQCIMRYGVGLGYFCDPLFWVFSIRVYGHYYKNWGVLGGTIYGRSSDLRSARLKA